jgi:adenylate cyclase
MKIVLLGQVRLDSIASTATPAPALPEKPFCRSRNMSGDPEQEYFADGMTEDLITDLSKVSGLFVIARNSSFAYKGRSVKVQEIGRDLGVRFVLEGGIQAGNRVRVTAQLIDAGSSGHLWAERFDRDLTTSFRRRTR